MFERPCTLLEKEGNSENSLGQVDLRTLYDDDVFGARIAAYSGNNANRYDDRRIFFKKQHHSLLLYIFVIASYFQVTKLME